MDLKGKVPEGAKIKYVRITDRDKSGGSWPGADIDAVAGLNSKIPATGNAWAQDELAQADELGLIPDCLNGADLTKPITRAEFAAVAVKAYEAMSGQKAVPIAQSPFSDCNDAEVLKAFNIGITNGSNTEGTLFSPKQLLNREQAAAMLTRVYKRVYLSGWTLATDSQFSLAYTKSAVFADDAKISPYAKDSVYFMAANDIIKGIEGNRFAPKNTTSAEEAQGFANATREVALLISVRMAQNPGN